MSVLRISVRAALAGVAVAAALGLTGCAGTPLRAPSGAALTDPQGVDLNRFYRDYADCSRLAAAVDPTGQALTGAGVGAVIGALVGNTQRVEGDGARGALWGAGLGAGVALSAAEQERQQVLRRCLRNRGYAVIR